MVTDTLIMKRCDQICFLPLEEEEEDEEEEEEKRRPKLRGRETAQGGSGRRLKKKGRGGGKGGPPKKKTFGRLEFRLKKSWMKKFFSLSWKEEGRAKLPVELG